MQILQRFSSKSNISLLLAFCFAIFLLPVPFSVIPKLTGGGPSWLGLDPSFQMTLNYALQHHISWGDELIATYGPLASLSNRVLWEIPKVYALLFDLFMLLNFMLVFRNFIREYHPVFAFFILLLTILLLNVHTGSTTSFVLFFFVIYWLNRYMKQQRIFFMLMSSLCIALCFYIKLNTGLFSIAVFVLYMINALWFRRISRKHMLVSLTALFFLLYLPSLLLHVNLASYIISGIYTMSGYNDIMYLYERHPEETWIWFSCIVTGLPALYALWQVYRNKERWLVAGILCTLVYMFLAWKQSVLRNDLQHISEFFGSAVLVIFLFNRSNDEGKPWLHMLTLTVIAGCLFAGKLNLWSFKTMFSERFTAPVQYIKDYSVAHNNKYVAMADKREIPKRVLDYIASETTDVFPWDGEYLIQNKLNYYPRPDFQSFLVYNSFLQQANYEAYIHNPPRFILYDYDAIDSRYPFNDEGMLNTFLASGYTIADTFTSNERLRLLLKRKAAPGIVLQKQVKQFKASIKDAVDVSQYDYIKIKLSRTLGGTMRSLLYKPSKLRIHYILENGERRVFRTSPAQLEAFIYTEKFVSDTKDFMSLMTAKRSLHNVSKIMLEDSAGAFQSDILISGYKFDNKDDDTIYLDHRHFPGGVFHNLDGKAVAALWNGSIVAEPVFLPRGNYQMTLHSKGTAVNQVFPHIRVFINDHQAGEFSATSDFSTNTVDFALSSGERIAIRIEMDNDADNKQNGDDRNFFLDWIRISRR